VQAAAVELLVALAAAQTAAVLPQLFALYAREGRDALPTAARLAVGEALARGVRAVAEGGTLPAHAKSLVGALTAVGVRGWRQQGELAAALTCQAAAFEGADGGKKAAPEGSDAAAALADWATLRASALSVLGDVCAHLGPRVFAGALADGVLDGLAGVLRHERGDLRPSAAVERAAPPPPVADAAAGADDGEPDDGDGDGGGGAEGLSSASAMLVSAAATQVRRAAALALRLLLDGAVGQPGGEWSPIGGDATNRVATLRRVHATLQETLRCDTDAATRQHAADAVVALEGVDWLL
jgi:hypothetical protein